MLNPAPQRLLHLLALTAFAIAAPLFELLRRYPEFLAVHGAGGADIFVIVLLSLLPLPLVMWLLEGGIALASTELSWRLHVIFVGLLAAVITLPPFGRLDELVGPLPIVFALAAGGGAAWLFVRYRPVRELLVWGTAAVPLFVGLLLFDPSIHRIAFSKVRAPEPSEARSDTPIVVVVFDALPTVSLMDRDLQIDAVRYPNFAELAAGSTWYRENTTVAYGTLPCVAAILDGRYPENERHPILVDHPQNLFTLTFDSHERNVLEPLTRLSPVRREGHEFYLAEVSRGRLLMDIAAIAAHIFTPPAYRDHLVALDQDWKDFEPARSDAKWRKRRKAPAFRAFLGEMQPTEKPALHFIHTILPHSPFRRFPSGRIYSAQGEDPSGAESWGDWEGMEWAIMHNQQRHLLQLQFVDSLLGELLGRIRELGIFDEAIIVVTADHGVGFEVADKRRFLTERNRPEVLGVPLFIKYPHQTGGEISTLPTETIDILPTIMEVAGIELPEPVDGFSLLGDGAASRTSKRQTFRSPISFPTDLLTPMRKAVERNVERFGDGRDDRLWSFGPHEDLLGRRVDELQIVDTPVAGVTVRDTDRFGDVRLDDDPLPCELFGEIELDGDDDVRALAVALNGEIVVTTQNYRTKQNVARPLWAALLPEGALLEGKNRLQVFLIGAGDAGQRILSPVD